MAQNYVVTCRKTQKTNPQPDVQTVTVTSPTSLSAALSGFWADPLQGADGSDVIAVEVLDARPA